MFRHTKLFINLTFFLFYSLFNFVLDLTMQNFETTNDFITFFFIIFR